MEVVLTGEHNSEFHFYAKPYLLKLNFFPNGFLDQDSNGNSSDNGNDEYGSKPESGVGTAKYDPSEQTVVVPLRKKRDNDDDNHWPDLDLTARMLEAKAVPKKWLHAVLDESSSSSPSEQETTTKIEECECQEENEAISGDNNNTNNSNPLLLGGKLHVDGYGFHDMFRNIFTDYCRSGLAEEMLELHKAGLDPENSTIDERRDGRLEQETNTFEFDRYLADLELSAEEEECNDYLYPMVRDYQPWWRKKDKLMSAATTADAASNPRSSLIQDMDNLAIRDGDQIREKSPPAMTTTATTTIFNDDEKLLLSTIPYPLLPKNLLTIPSINNDHDKTAKYRLWCGALELVLAYIYDHLTTMGDPTVESSWTISILSCGLSWLDSGPTVSVKDTLTAFLRRILVHPYWRNADDFGFRIVKESRVLLQTHRTTGATKAFLRVRTILDKSEAHYLGNKLLVDPYLYWIQNVQDGGGLDAILSELGAFVTDDGFAGLLSDVEQSLGIDEMMTEYFGEEEDDASSSCESESSSDDEEEDTDDEEKDDVDGDDHDDGDKHDECESECETPTALSKNTTSTLAVDREDAAKHTARPAPAIQLLDDQVGDGQRQTVASSMLYCIQPHNDVRSNNTGSASKQSPLITTVESSDAATATDALASKQSPLITTMESSDAATATTDALASKQLPFITTVKSSDAATSTNNTDDAFEEDNKDNDAEDGTLIEATSETIFRNC